MSQKDNDSEEVAIDNFTELTQLVKSTLQTVDELFPPKPEFSFENMMIQFYTLKSIYIFQQRLSSCSDLLRYLS